MRDLPDDWRPFQLDLVEEPFWLLVACVLVNRTKWRGSADQALTAIRQKWSSPEALSEADVVDVERPLRSLGLYRRRARSLINLATAWSDGERDVAALPGCGHYAADSWAIFVEGRTDVEPSDEALQAYVARTKK